MYASFWNNRGSYIVPGAIQMSAAEADYRKSLKSRKRYMGPIISR